MKLTNIANCDKHCGFVPRDLETQAAGDDDYVTEDDLPLAMLAANLCASGVDIDDEALHLFLEVDYDVATSVPLTYDCIIQEVQSSSEATEEVTTVPTTSFAQAMEYLSLLRRLMVSLPQPVYHHDSHWAELTTMETDFEKSHHSLLKQKSIKNFSPRRQY